MIVLRLNEYDLLTLSIMLKSQIKVYARNGKSFYRDLTSNKENTYKHNLAKELLEYQIKDIKKLVRVYKEITNTLNFLKEY